MSLVHGQNPSGYLKPLLVDAAGNVLIAGTVNANLNAGANVIGKVDINSSPTLDVHLMTGANLAGKVDINTAPTLTVQGTNSDKLLSISNPIYGTGGSLDLPVGDSSYTIFTCPAGFIYHVGNLSGYYSGTVANVFLEFFVTTGGVPYYIRSFYNLVSTITVSALVDCYLKPADTLTLKVHSATLHDVGLCWLAGYSLHTT